ncbi:MULTISPECIES: flagellin N-terminal helical domain-containing protein [Vibrio]|uniref:Flagellin n=1 Tax=Vibrio diazotrophicus TaxID=685 RepID=A0ABX4W9D0_VIBDI|nr:flagellin [Vibrio diazotrophicus]PNI00121.1 Lateral flagellin [Vibrio diazotrophicus]
MAISLHTNYANLVTQNTLNSTNNALSTSMERLSTGYRVNSAADDAAGLQIANRLELQSRGMSVASRNSQDAISMMQTAESAMDEMTNIAYRMNDLATQAANGSNTDADRAALDSEFQALASQLSEMTQNTNFGGQKLLGAEVTSGATVLSEAGVFAASGGVTFQTGSTTAEQTVVDVTSSLGSLNTALTAFADLSLQAGAGGYNASGTPTSGGVYDASGNLDTGTANSSAAMDALEGFINVVGESRAAFGAQINNLEHNINNLANMTENLEASKGRIMDTDFASESGNMSKNQMLMQSGAQMLSATKTIPQLAMSMLG